MSTVQEFVYNGSHWHKASPDLSRCVFSVAEYGRVTDWHQCHRKPVEKIQDFGFCKLHANQVKRRLGLLKPIKTRYAASFEHGSANLSLIHVAKETSRTIEITKVESILGSMNIWSGFVKKDSQYHKAVKFFDEKKDALKWLMEKVAEYLDVLEERIIDANNVHGALLDEWNKE